MAENKILLDNDYYYYLLKIQNKALKETLAELEESRNRYADLFDFAPVGYITLDKNNRIIEINHFAANLLQQERYKLMGVPLTNFIAEEQLPAFYQHIETCKETKEQVVTELSLKTKKDRSCHLQLLSKQVIAENEHNYYKIIINDITDRKGFEQNLSRMEQLQLAGQMAASIAHEIRNPMATVTGFLQLLREKEEGKPHEEYFSIMIDELNRANHILAEFLTLAKDKNINMKMQNLNHIINQLYPLLKADANIADKKIQLQLNELPDIILDDKEIRQLIINLVKNGLEAMEVGKTLIIGTKYEKDRVVLAVKDQGTGIKPELVKKLGTPFVTTKDNGTGLGLAVCYSIADRHHAIIQAETGPLGTTMYVKFNI